MEQAADPRRPGSRLEYNRAHILSVARRELSANADVSMDDCRTRPLRSRPEAPHGSSGRAGGSARGGRWAAHADPTRPVSTWPARRRRKAPSQSETTVRSYQPWLLRVCAVRVTRTPGRSPYVAGGSLP